MTTNFINRTFCRVSLRGVARVQHAALLFGFFFSSVGAI